MITAHAFDAMVLLTNCDKVTPGMLMAAARLNIPALLVAGGPMDTGCFRGQRVCYNDLMEAEGLVKRGKMPPEELAAFEEVAVWGPGACVGHVTPEAYLGGPLAFVQEGDPVVIDIPAGRIDLDVPAAVIEQRRKAWRLPEHTALAKGTLLERYRWLVGPTTRGAKLE